MVVSDEMAKETKDGIDRKATSERPTAPLLEGERISPAGGVLDGRRSIEREAHEITPSSFHLL